MTFTYDPTTSIGKVRMLIPDRVEDNAIFSDEEIEALLSMNGSNVRRATAEALETIASDEVMTLKVLSTLDLSTNGASVSSAILERAKILRTKADDDDLADEGGGFDYAEMGVNAFTRRERFVKQAQRDNS
jgi:hypothetical protein